MSYPRFTIEYGEAIEHWRACVANPDNAPGGRESRYLAHAWDRALPDDSFYGASAEQMEAYLTDGYAFEGIAGVPLVEQPVERERWQWTDDPEGEYDHTAYMNGEPEYYRTRARREKRGGVSVEIELGAQAGTPFTVLADYGVFIGNALSEILTRGSDLECSILWRGSGSLVGLGHVAECEIVVSRFGEDTSMREWSAFFAPGGYRHLGFAARAYAETKGIRVGGMGSCSMTEWGVEFDSDTRTLRLCMDWIAQRFPVEQMTRELEEVMDI